MSGEAPDGERTLVRLRQELRELVAEGQLVAEAAGPLRRVSVRSGDTLLEVEWSAPAGTAPPPALAVPAPPEAEPTAGDPWLVSSPIVGTFYRSSEPGAAPFVEVGDVIEPGQVVGIVEAMKLMNHITAEQGGKVAEVLVSDGEPVEFQQPLIALVSG